MQQVRTENLQEDHGRTKIPVSQVSQISSADASNGQAVGS